MTLFLGFCVHLVKSRPEYILECSFTFNDVNNGYKEFDMETKIEDDFEQERMLNEENGVKDVRDVNESDNGIEEKKPIQEKVEKKSDLSSDQLEITNMIQIFIECK